MPYSTVTRRAAPLALALALSGHAAQAQTRMPSNAEAATKQSNASLFQQLPFHDESSFEEARRGFVAAPQEVLVKAPDGRVIYSSKIFDFTASPTAPDSVNPSLWRLSRLNAIFGLFKVTDKIYQIRGFDLANMTVIEGDTGLIIIDTLFTAEAARNAIEFYFSQRPRKPIHTIIYTHSHPDHYGGVRGLVSEDDVKSGKVKIIAPRDFLEPAVSENILAGNAQARRLQYQFGFFLPRNEKGLVDSGLGKDLSRSVITLIPPTDSIVQPFEHRVIDGVEIDFMLTPGTEAPAEMIMYFPQFKVLDMAEIATQLLHNVYTLRGAEIRDSNIWAKNLNTALQAYGDKAEVLIASHTWPVWSSPRIKNFLSKQRDLYKFIHDQSVRLLNQGYVGTEIAERLRLPKSLSGEWFARGYYGTLSHNVRGVYQKYLGFYSSNPAELNPLPPTATAKKYVEYMGGAEAVIRRAREEYANGEYRWVAQVMNQVVYADPANQDAKDLEASALEQLAYQSESAIWRNEYLAGAYELRNGRAHPPAVRVGSPDTIKALTTDMIFDYLAVRLNGERAEGKKIALNWKFTDTSQNYALNLENSALTYTANKLMNEADATLILSRQLLNAVLLRETSIDQAVKAGQIKIEGNGEKLTELLSLFDEPELMFGIVTPDRGPT
ncbi:alkyl/aryl-sulfatase [Methylobacterium oryzisoli]|uniref:alkyl/aryl-sulfatase n=1 Tax=Methylobacterium oryzisoli TaxID=3385502 RepID=UPI0038929258